MAASKKSAPQKSPTPRKYKKAHWGAIRTGPVSDDEAIIRLVRVIQIAGDNFLEQGFRGASIDHIARRSRVSKMTIYRVYGNKEKLFKEFIISNISGFRGNLVDLLSSDRPSREVLHDVVRLMVDTVSHQRTFAILRLAIAERNRFPSVARMVFDQTNELRRPVAEYLKSMSGKKRMSSEEADRRAFHLMNLAIGGFGVLLNDPQTFYGDRDAWIQSVLNTFFDGFPTG